MTGSTVPPYPLTRDDAFWETHKPETALALKDVKPGDRITAYVPNHPEYTRHVIIESAAKQAPLGGEVVAHGGPGEQELLFAYRNLDTGALHVGPPSGIGLTLSEWGSRYCWAIPYTGDEG